MASHLAVVAIGGNSLIQRRGRQSVEDQYAALCETMGHVADIAAGGRQLLITHGNAPQLGFVMLRSEIVRAAAGLHMAPLADCEAGTQGSLGYQVMQALGNELRRRGLPADKLAALVTRTRVDAHDPSMHNPGSFVGECYDEAQLPSLARQHPDWALRPDAGGSWRRVVPSPEPLEIMELPAIRALLDAGFHVAAAGGGGIPVTDSPEGLRGVDAVVDKYLATVLLANSLRADLLLISTAVEHVCLNYGSMEQTPLGRVHVDDLEGYYKEGHFPQGTMGPKIRAAIRYLRQGGREAIITSPEHMRDALEGGAGTHIYR